MAAAAKEPSWVDWDEEEEEEEEETVSATVEARAVVAGVEVAVCAAGSRGAAPGRLAGLCPRARGAESSCPQPCGPRGRSRGKEGGYLR